MASDRVQVLRERAERARARALAAEARERDAARRRQTHARIVAGALVLDRPDLFGLDAGRLRALLDGAVTRPHDRRALGLDDVAPAVTGDVP